MIYVYAVYIKGNEGPVFAGAWESYDDAKQWLGDRPDGQHWISQLAFMPKSGQQIVPDPFRGPPLDIADKLPQLLPCPFCGGAAAALKNDRGAWAQIECVSCSARSCEHPNDFQLVARAWNRRTLAVTIKEPETVPIEWIELDLDPAPSSAPDAFRNALMELADGYVETPSDAADAIEALEERADFLRRWADERCAEQEGT